MKQSHITQSTQLWGIDIPVSVFENSLTFIGAVRAGLPGAVVREAIEVLGHRELFAKILEVKSANLNRFYRRKRLNKTDSESILDLLRLISEAALVFKSRDLANEWLSSILPALGGKRPADLCDTFEGRKLVRVTLRKVEYGDFS
ncbi:antitoxin Xre/MbcA/ParS toxin-binding domain-containing protein [Litorivivens sp.]|uniref:antitoxin Xre/MbcA/ParS toxin-binding domain-containing protein n=1 Tax=Litorivivens sp. TaxID=2020868 RepID=UPI003566692E